MDDTAFSYVREPRELHAELHAAEAAAPAGVMHLWRAGLGLEAARLRRWEQNLSADEWARATRCSFARDRERFITARGYSGKSWHFTWIRQHGG